MSNKRIADYDEQTDAPDDDQHILIEHASVLGRYFKVKWSRLKTWLSLTFQRKSYAVVATDGSGDYNCNGTDDDVEIQEALDNHQRVFIKDGAYNTTDFVYMRRSYQKLIAESNDVIIRASQSLFTSGTDNARSGVLTVHPNTSADVKKVVVQDVTLDANHQYRTAAASIFGGNKADGENMHGIDFVGVRFINAYENTSDPGNGTVRIISGDAPHGAYGQVTKPRFIDCYFGDTENDSMYVLGQDVTGLRVINCEFEDAHKNHISYTAYEKGDTKLSAGRRSARDWLIEGCKFKTWSKDPVLGWSAFEDSSRIGIFGLKLKNNYFDNQSNYDTDEIAINIHAVQDYEIVGNTFYKNREALSLGESNAGSAYKVAPSQFGRIRNNLFYKNKFNIDYDATANTRWSNNIFYECEEGGLNPYSTQTNVSFHDNLFYNCVTEPYVGVGEYRKAMMSLGGNGYDVRGNRFVDDRELIDPPVAPVLTQVAGGALSARTYYVKITYINDTGETLASPQASISVSANNLLQVDMAQPKITPSGTKKIGIYVSTTSGSETKQAEQSYEPHVENEITETYPFISVYNILDWKEPDSGLVAGSALPGSNTTHTVAKYGIYETDSSSYSFRNIYKDNYFYGFEKRKEIFRQNNKGIDMGNWAVQEPDYDVGGDNLPTSVVYDTRFLEYEESISSAYTIDMNNGAFQKLAMGANITFTFSDGDHVGQLLTIHFIQDGTGLRVATLPSNVKKAGGSLTLTATANAIDVVELRWDGINWLEASRSLNIS